MKLYIANGTQQNQDFNYRMLESQKVYRQPINIGQQIGLSPNMSQKDVDYVIQQHAAYGMVDVREIHRVPKNKFIALCYSVDKVISSAQIQQLLIHNQIAQGKLGEELRRNTAVAINNALEEQTKQIGTLNETSVTIIEENADNASHEGGPVAEGVIVDKRRETNLKPEKGRSGNRRTANG